MYKIDSSTGNIIMNVTKSDGTHKVPLCTLIWYVWYLIYFAQLCHKKYKNVSTRKKSIFYKLVIEPTNMKNKHFTVYPCAAFSLKSH